MKPKQLIAIAAAVFVGALAALFVWQYVEDRKTDAALRELRLPEIPAPKTWRPAR